MSPLIAKTHLVDGLVSIVAATLPCILYAYWSIIIITIIFHADQREVSIDVHP